MADMNGRNNQEVVIEIIAWAIFIVMIFGVVKFIKYIL